MRIIRMMVWELDFETTENLMPKIDLKALHKHPALLSL
jgi:hypothetical protein